MGHTISVIEEYEYDPLKNDPEPYYALEARLMQEHYDYLISYIFIFDRMEYEHLKEYNISNLYYLPMSANLSRTGLLEIASQDEKNYSCDISFIGNLYEENIYNEIISLLPESLALELKAYLMKNLCNWKKTKLWPSTSHSLTTFLDEVIVDNPCCNYDIEHSLYYGMLLEFPQNVILK